MNFTGSRETKQDSLIALPTERAGYIRARQSSHQESRWMCRELTYFDPLTYTFSLRSALRTSSSGTSGSDILQHARQLFAWVVCERWSWTV
jgi:hypothetical protein